MKTFESYFYLNYYRCNTMVKIETIFLNTYPQSNYQVEL